MTPGLLASGAASAPIPWAMWVAMGAGVLAIIALFAMVVAVVRNMTACRDIVQSLKDTAGDGLRWGEIAQRQTELMNPPLLKVTEVAGLSEDGTEGVRISVQNVGFGSAVNVGCAFVQHAGGESQSETREMVGCEVVHFDSELDVDAVANVRIDYMSPCGSYSHTTQYEIKTGAQSYALHRCR